MPATLSSEYLLNSLSTVDCSEDPEHIQELFQWCRDLQQIGTKWLDLPAAIAEFQTHHFGWFKQGMLLESIFRGGKWRDYAGRWRDWCEQFTGQTGWYCRNLIKGSQVLLVLMAEGCDRLPRCLAQCEPLFKYLTKDGGAELAEKWREVLDACPLDHHLTAGRIKEVLGEIDPPKKRRIGLSADVYEQLHRRAMAEGKSPEDLIREWLGEDDPSPPSPHEEPGKTPTEDASAIAHWQDDLNQLIQEHDADSNVHRPAPTPASPTDPGPRTRPEPQPSDSLSSSIPDRSDGGNRAGLDPVDRTSPAGVGRRGGEGLASDSHPRPGASRHSVPDPYASRHAFNPIQHLT